MFLLIHAFAGITAPLATYFKFHYVSINSLLCRDKDRDGDTL